MGTYTQNYNFYIPDGSEFGEIIKLVLEPNFTIIDQQLKNLKDKFESYYTETEIDEKFKNFCPYSVGEILLTTNSENPASKYLGTTWQKIEGRMLKGTSGAGASKQTGGKDTVTLTTANIPSHTHSATTAAHTHTQPTHTHKIKGYNNEQADGPNLAGAGGWEVTQNATTESAGGETTGSASPVISIGSTGSGTAFSVLNAYYTVHMWLRTA